mmetsp:Transcript_1720/g.2528  ORF Transcript_1720/g.2528 Transcript_1720/m.2528 type:complete len:1210 (+) Transcript_1720:31-3660(+)
MFTKRQTIKRVMQQRIVASPTIDNGGGVQTYLPSRNRIEWGKNNLIAVGVQDTIEILCPKTKQRITTLGSSRQKQITALKWSTGRAKYGTERGNSAMLAVGDEEGTLIVWDALKGTKMFIHYGEVYLTKMISQALLQSRKKKMNRIIQIEWLSDVHILCMEQSGKISLYNVTHSKQAIWTIDLDEVISFDIKRGYQIEMVISHTNGSVTYIGDINYHKQPEKIEQLFQIRNQNEDDSNLPYLRDVKFNPFDEGTLLLITKNDLTVYDKQLNQKRNDTLNVHYMRMEWETIHFHPTNKKIMYSIHAEGKALIWDLNLETKKHKSKLCDITRSMRHLGLVGSTNQEGLFGVSINPHNFHEMVCVAPDGRLCFWNHIAENENHPSRFQLTGYIDRIKSKIMALQQGPDNYLAAGCENGKLYVYDLTTSTLKLKQTVFNDLPLRSFRWYSKNEVICYSFTKDAQTGLFENHLLSVNVTTGEQIQMDRSHDKEYNIKGIRVSKSKRFLMVLYERHPIQIWDLKTHSVVRVVPVYKYTACCWCPYFSKIPKKQYTVNGEKGMYPVAEFFMVALPSGAIQIYKVDEKRCVPDNTHYRLDAGTTLSAMSMNSHYVAGGDSNGYLHVWDLKNNTLRRENLHRGEVKTIRFSEDNHLVMIHFSSRRVAIFDLRDMKAVSISPKTLNIIYVEWTRNNLPICLTNTFTILVMDQQFSKTNNLTRYHMMNKPLQTPALLPHSHAKQFKELLMLNAINVDTQEVDKELLRVKEGSNMVESTITEPVEDEEEQEEQETNDEVDDIIRKTYLGETFVLNKMEKLLPFERVAHHIQLLPTWVKDKCRVQDLNLMERYLTIAKYYSDELATLFWTIAKHYVPQFQKNQVVDVFDPDEHLRQRTQSFVDAEGVKSNIANEMNKDDSLAAENVIIDPLPSTMGNLRDAHSVQSHYLDELNKQDVTARKNSSVPFFSSIARHQAQANQHEKAVNLLLETPHGDNNIHLNYMHACVISACKGPQHFRQTMSQVAASLLSFETNNPEERATNMDRSIELFCLIGEGFKACTILQNFDYYERSVQLAKTILPTSQLNEILIRYAFYHENCSMSAKTFTSHDHLWKALETWLSLGYYYNVLDLLHQMEMTDLGMAFFLYLQTNNIAILRCPKRQMHLSHRVDESTDVDEAYLLKKLHIRLLHPYINHLATNGFGELADYYEAKLNELNVKNEDE